MCQFITGYDPDICLEKVNIRGPAELSIDKCLDDYNADNLLTNHYFTMEDMHVPVVTLSFIAHAKMTWVMAL